MISCGIAVGWAPHFPLPCLPAAGRTSGRSLISRVLTYRPLRIVSSQGRSSVHPGSSSGDAILSARTLAPFDDCGGHVNPVMGYHVHAVTGCLRDIPTETGHAPEIGLALDGYRSVRCFLDVHGINGRNVPGFDKRPSTMRHTTTPSVTNGMPCKVIRFLLWVTSSSSPMTLTEIGWTLRFLP